MITELAESLYDLVVELNMAIDHNASTLHNIQTKGTKLKNEIQAFENSPQILYRELFEDWRKADILKICRLVDNLCNKGDEWSGKSIRLLPDMPILFSVLCRIIDVIQQRRPDIIAELTPTPQPDTSTTPIIDLVTEPTTAAGEPPEEWRLPSELDTERARKYFPRAINAGWMKPDSGTRGFKWEFGGPRGGKARLGYFVWKVYCPTNKEKMPENAINKLFGVNRIGSSITQLFDAQKPQKWKGEIDSLFEY